MDQIQANDDRVLDEESGSGSLKALNLSQSISSEPNVAIQEALNEPVSLASSVFRYAACSTMRCNSALLISSLRCAFSSCCLSCSCTACTHACTDYISGLTNMYSSTCLHTKSASMATSTLKYVSQVKVKCPQFKSANYESHQVRFFSDAKPFSAVQHSILPTVHAH